MNYKTSAIFAIILSILPGFFYARAEQRYNASFKSEILSLVVPTHTMATVLADCSPQASPNVFSPAVCRLKKNAAVEVLRDYSESWYLVESADMEACGWLPAKLIKIHPDNVRLREMTVFELEAFANIMEFPAPKGVFVWTDVARQRTHVFNKKNGAFSHVKTLVCATGKPSSPTTRGFFTVNGRGEWFYSRRLGSGGKYWVRFNDTYLFHSVAMDRNKKVTDGVLGERRSSGCVRLSVSDAQWFFENVPDGATVFIY